MKTLLTLLFALLMTAGANAQSDAYSANVKKGLDLYYRKDYSNSAKAFSLAFALNGGKGTETDRYNAACSWALAGNADSAFHYLFDAAEKNHYYDYNHITIDEDLVSIHSDKRWDPLLKKIEENKAKAEANFIKPVVAILDTVYQDDQKPRQGIVPLIQKEGMQSPAVQEKLKEMHYYDSVDLVKVEKILDEYGWLGFDKIGKMGALTLFLVIQHSPLKVQEKYLPMMREAVKNKQAFAGNLALLEDRVALGEGRKQIYGSQLRTDTVTHKNILLPLEDPENVDKRRAEVGLGPLADYLKSFGVEWDPQAFKKQQDEAEIQRFRLQ
jgi:hypothetical protein